MVGSPDRTVPAPRRRGGRRLAEADASIWQRCADLVDRHRLDRHADVRLLLDLQPRARAKCRPSALDLLWSMMFVIISVIYRPIEQLLSRTIAERRARGHEQQRLSVPIAIQASFALVFLMARWRCGASAMTKCSTTTRPSTGCSWSGRSHTPPATSRGAGWRDTSTSALFGGLVLIESVSRLCFALPRWRRHRTRANGRRARDRGGAVRFARGRAGGVRAQPRRAPSELWTRAGRDGAPAELPAGPITSRSSMRRWPGREPRACRRRSSAMNSRCAAGGLRVLGRGVMLSEQTLLNARGVDGRHHLERTRRWPGSCST